MFEKFTVPARQVIFFARYEASEYGSTTIETEHFLLGLIRTSPLLLRRVLPDSRGIDSIREHIDQRTEIREKTSTSIDIPLSEECKHILAYAAEEAEIIEPGHLLLGILREENCLAAKILTGLGVHIVVVRGEVSKSSATEAGRLHHLTPQSQELIPTTPLPKGGVVPDAETAKSIAEAVWELHSLGGPLTHVKAQKAELKHGVWIVEGTFDGDTPGFILTAFIQKEDGKILRRHLEQLDS